MNCRKAQQAISERHDGRLAPGAAARLDAHLATCADCRAFAAGLAAVGAHLRARPGPAGPTPEAAWAGVQRAIRLQQDGPVARGWWSPQPWLRWASAAALVVFVAGGALVWRTDVEGRREVASHKPQVASPEAAAPAPGAKV